MSNESEIIYPLHPAFNKEDIYTIDDCYKIGAILGISPQTVAGFISGRILPNELIINRLKEYFDEEIINNIINNYEPLRYIEYTDNIIKKNIRKKYPISLLKQNDSILTDDNKWVKISKIEFINNNVVIYSGGVKCAVLNNKNFIIAHLAFNDSTNQQDKVERVKNIEYLKNELLNSDEDDLIERNEFFNMLMNKYKNN